MPPRLAHKRSKQLRFLTHGWLGELYGAEVAKGADGLTGPDVAKAYRSRGEGGLLDRDLLDARRDRPLIAERIKSTSRFDRR